MPISLRLTDPKHRTDLYTVIRSAWRRKTVNPTRFGHDAWRPITPYIGQAAVTTLFLFDLLGGEILMTPLETGEPHFYLRVSEHEVIDLVRKLARGTLHPGTRVIDRAALIAAEAELEARLSFFRDRFEEAEAQFWASREAAAQKPPT